MGGPEYAELISQSAFSFQEGASLPEELVERAHTLGLSALGVCDRGVHGLVRAWRAGCELGLEVLHGATVAAAGLPELVLYAEDLGGWGRLCELLTRIRRSWGALDELLLDTRGLVALVGGDWSAHPEHASALADAFGDRLYITAARLLRAGDDRAMAAAEALSRRLGRPVVASCRVLLHTRARQRVQDVLTCQRHGVRLADAGGLLEPNAERCLRAPRELALLFRERPGWVRRTLEVAERCRFRAGALRPLLSAAPERARAGARDPLQGPLASSRWDGQRAALVGEVLNWQARSALRAVGEAMGLAPAVQEPLLQGPPAGDDPRLELVRQVAGELRGLPRRPAIPAGRPVSVAGELRRLVPVESVTPSGHAVIQWSRDDLAAIFGAGVVGAISTMP